MPWLVLLTSWPAGGPSTGRVSAWRKIRQLGAVSLPGGAAVLPDQPAQHEALQWLRQEIEAAGGEAVLLHVGRLEGLTEAGLIDCFNSARTAEYHELHDLAEQVRQSGGSARGKTLLTRLKKRYAEIQRIDFFQAPAGTAFRATLEQLHALFRPPDASPALPKRSPAQFQSRVWSTRPAPKVDRLASGWLIRRFIDPQAVLVYELEHAEHHVTFDRPAGDFTHVGALCTFEVLMQSFGIQDTALSVLGDIVHELDLHDGQRIRPETAGVEAMLRGLFKANLPDKELEAAAHPLFDTLYRAFATVKEPRHATSRTSNRRPSRA